MLSLLFHTWGTREDRLGYLLKSSSGFGKEVHQFWVPDWFPNLLRLLNYQGTMDESSGRIQACGSTERGGRLKRPGPHHKMWLASNFYLAVYRAHWTTETRYPRAFWRLHAVWNVSTRGQASATDAHRCFCKEQLCKELLTTLCRQVTRHCWRPTAVHAAFFLFMYLPCPPFLMFYFFHRNENLLTT